MSGTSSSNWQRCQTHYQRNAGSKVHRRARQEVHRQLRDLFDAPGQAQAQERANRIVSTLQDRFPELATWLEETIDEPLNVFSLPSEHRKRLRTTNGLERYHQEVRRRTRVVRIFPNRASCLRLTTALAMEQSEDWLTNHRYLNMQDSEEDLLAVQSNVLISASALLCKGQCPILKERIYTQFLTQLCIPGFGGGRISGSLVKKTT